MIIDPPENLFNCPSCHSDEGITRICIDGIAAGFDFDKMRSLSIISQKCQAVPPQAHRAQSIRERTGFFLHESIGKLLVQAIKSKKNFITERNLGYALHALYFVCPEIVAERSSAPKLFSYSKGELGEERFLEAIQDFTAMLFQRSTVAHRLARMIRPHLEKRMNLMPLQNRNLLQRKEEHPLLKGWNHFCPLMHMRRLCFFLPERNQRLEFSPLPVMTTFHGATLDRQWIHA